MRAAQLTFDGREEAPELERRGLSEFMALSEKEGGLFLQSQAAVALDLHPSRIGQMIDAGILSAWDFFGKRYVSCRQVAARRVADVKGGRPRRTLGERIVATGKVLAKVDGPQLVSAAVGK
jgi:hypothetical protein